IVPRGRDDDAEQRQIPQVAGDRQDGDGGMALKRFGLHHQNGARLASGNGDDGDVSALHRQPFLSTALSIRPMASVSWGSSASSADWRRASASKAWRRLVSR